MAATPYPVAQLLLQAGGVLPDSVEQIQEKHAEGLQAEAELDRRAAEKLERDNNMDQFDKLMEEHSQSDDEAPDAASKKKRKRQPGLRAGSPDREAVAKQMPRKKAAGGHSKTGKKPSAAPVPAPCSMEHAMSDTAQKPPQPGARTVGDGETASASASKAGSASKAKLDPEMDTVAQVHLESNKGSSVRCLEGFEMAAYLKADDTARHSLAAKLRGVCRSVLVCRAATAAVLAATSCLLYCHVPPNVSQPLF